MLICDTLHIAIKYLHSDITVNRIQKFVVSSPIEYQMNKLHLYYPNED